MKQVGKGCRGVSILKRIGNVLSTVLVAAMVVLAVALVGVRLVGFEVFSVLSGSMEPAYRVGSLIWVQEREASEVEVGDPITFVLNEDLDVATHRVIEIDAENQHFYTKGDANDAPDGSPVHFNNLIGVPVFTVPYLGYFVSWIQSPPGTYIAIIVVVAVVALMVISSVFDGKEAKAPKGGVSVPRGVSRAQARPAYAGAVSPTLVRTAASVPFESLTPEQRAAYARRELERRRKAAASTQGSDSERRSDIDKNYRKNANPGKLERR